MDGAYKNTLQNIQGTAETMKMLAYKQAKCFQFRLAEVCSVWNGEPNAILNIQFHRY